MLEFSGMTDDELDELLWYEETLSGEVVRASGSVACELCGFAFRQHPYDPEIGYDGYHYLKVACDGTRLKL